MSDINFGNILEAVNDKLDRDNKNIDTSSNQLVKRYIVETYDDMSGGGVLPL